MKTASNLVHTLALGAVLAVHLSAAGGHFTGMRRALQTMASPRPSVGRSVGLVRCAEA